MKRSLLLAGVGLLAFSRLGEGQGRETLGSLRTGDTIKVWAVAPRLNGSLGGFGGFRADTLTLHELPFSASADVRARVPYASLRRVDVRRGMRRSVGRTAIGVVLGAGAGLIVGAALGTAIECGSNCGDDGDLEGIVGFLFGGGIGGIAGGIAGGVIAARPRPHWETVDLRR